MRTPSPEAATNDSLAVREVPPDWRMPIFGSGGAALAESVSLTFFLLRNCVQTASAKETRTYVLWQETTFAKTTVITLRECLASSDSACAFPTRARSRT
jgi:hypothetical protein